MSLHLGNIKIPGVRVSKEIIGGVILPELDNPASNANVIQGYEYIDEDGNKKTGSFTVEPEISEQDTLLSELQTVLSGKANGGAADPVLQSKTVTPSTSQQTVTPDNGYDGLSDVTVDTIPDQYLAEAEVTAQDDLIANILTALDGKAAGGSGSVVETCNVTLITTDSGFSGLASPSVRYISYEQYGYGFYPYNNTIEYNESFDVICGSYIIFAAHVAISVESVDGTSHIDATKNNVVYIGTSNTTITITSSGTANPFG